MHTEFLSPALLDEQLTVAAYISAFRTTSLTINFDVMQSGTGKLRATAYQVLTCVGRGDLRKKPLPADFVAALRPFTMSAEEARAVAAAGG
jgi:acyl-CoA thioesterase FadM